MRRRNIAGLVRSCFMLPGTRRVAVLQFRCLELCIVQSRLPSPACVSSTSRRGEESRLTEYIGCLVVSGLLVAMCYRGVCPAVAGMEPGG